MAYMWHIQRNVFGILKFSNSASLQFYLLSPCLWIMNCASKIFSSWKEPFLDHNPNYHTTCLLTFCSKNHCKSCSFAISDFSVNLLQLSFCAHLSTDTTLTKVANYLHGHMQRSIFSPSRTYQFLTQLIMPSFLKYILHLNSGTHFSVSFLPNSFTVSFEFPS